MTPRELSPEGSGSPQPPREVEEGIAGSHTWLQIGSGHCPRYLLPSRLKLCLEVTRFLLSALTGKSLVSHKMGLLHVREAAAKVAEKGPMAQVGDS